MSQFTANTHRADPYENFKFRIKWEGRYVAGFSKVSSLKRSTEVVEHRDGGDPSTSRTSPRRSKYEPITLERGVTHDADFQSWANGVKSAHAGAVSQKLPHRELILEVLNEAGQIVHIYKLHRCWVSKIVDLPDLDANANALAIEHIALENEGWEKEPLSGA